MRIFRRKANRFCVYFNNVGLVPIASDLDDKPVFETEPPSKVGEQAVIHVEGKRRSVILLSSGSATYLVDCGEPTEMKALVAAPVAEENQIHLARMRLMWAYDPIGFDYLLRFDSMYGQLEGDRFHIGPDTRQFTYSCRWSPEWFDPLTALLLIEQEAMVAIERMALES